MLFRSLAAVITFADSLASPGVRAEENDLCSSSHSLPKQLARFRDDLQKNQRGNFDVRERNLRRRCEELRGAVKIHSPEIVRCQDQATLALNSCDKFENGN